MADNPYLQRIASQHAQRPKFRALVDALTQPFALCNMASHDIAACFDLDTAVGVQLDQVGFWIGVGRRLRTPLENVYFSLDIEGLGFDQGVWRGRHDPETGLTILPDDQYRTLLKARIAANHWDGTIPGAYRVWEVVFRNERSIIFIQDNQDMSMIVGIAGLPLNAVLQALLTGGYIPLKPEGVRIRYYAVGTAEGPLFGFDVHNDALAGFDTGQWAQILYPSPLA
jgi:Protein of unknown function (DUF2612).